MERKWDVSEVNCSPKIFVSYAWKDEKPDKNVLKLINEMREMGFDIECDLILSDRETSINFNLMMEQSMKLADKVIIIVNKNYRNKADKQTGNRTGVAIEYQYILNEINAVSNKFIIVSFEKDWKENIPYGLAGREILYIPIEDIGRDKYWDLCRKILSVPKYAMSDVGNKIVIPRPISLSENDDNDNNKNDDNDINDENIDDFNNDCSMDLSKYYNYRGGPIPQIEMRKYQMTCNASYLIGYGLYKDAEKELLEIAKICRNQNKKRDAYLLEHQAFLCREKDILQTVEFNMKYFKDMPNIEILKCVLSNMAEYALKICDYSENVFCLKLIEKLCKAQGKSRDVYLLGITIHENSKKYANYMKPIDENMLYMKLASNYLTELENRK